MTVHLKRERHRINREVHRRNDLAGESVVWYEFQPLTAGAGSSTYDDVYDEGPVGAEGLSFTDGVTIPTIYIEEVEDDNRAIEDGRQPTQNVKITFRMKDLTDAGISAPREYQPHLNDMFLYDNRFYRVYKYKARGFMEDEEVLVAVEGVEIYADQELVNENPPTALAVNDLWPDALLGSV